jgi:transposase
VFAEKHKTQTHEKFFDNSKESIHPRYNHTQEVQDEIAKGGHQILFRPAYSPDFAPMELLFENQGLH